MDSPLILDDPHRMLISGLGAIILIEIYAAVMQREFQYTNNRVGKGFAILGIYLFDVAYCVYPQYQTGKVVRANFIPV
jgi:hypothetical protein